MKILENFLPLPAPSASSVEFRQDNNKLKVSLKDRRLSSNLEIFTAQQFKNDSLLATALENE